MVHSHPVNHAPNPQPPGEYHLQTREHQARTKKGPEVEGWKVSALESLVKTCEDPKLPKLHNNMYKIV
jgi:hypothetical protein